MWRVAPALYPILIICGLCAPMSALAHPHVWVTVETEVLYDQQKAITGFRHKWAFDEAYSSFAILGLDKNNDGNYDREELNELAEVNISSLKEFDFFTFPKLAGKLLGRQDPKDYWLEYADGILTLFLTLPLTHPVPVEKTKDFTFAVYDPTFYVDFALAKDNPVRLASAPSGCAPVIKEPNPQAAAQSGVSTLGETFFNKLDSSSTIAEQYAKLVSISCPAS